MTSDILRNMGRVLKSLGGVARASTKSQRPYIEARIAQYDSLIADKKAEIIECAKYPTGDTYARVCEDNIEVLKKLRAKQVEMLRLER